MWELQYINKILELYKEFVFKKILADNIISKVISMLKDILY
jgi:hypothetical protein